jgi:hypothetical protein
LGYHLLTVALLGSATIVVAYAILIAFGVVVNELDWNTIGSIVSADIPVGIVLW